MEWEGLGHSFYQDLESRQFDITFEEYRSILLLKIQDYQGRVTLEEVPYTSLSLPYLILSFVKLESRLGLSFSR